MDRIELEVASREVLGKEVRFLRRQGITPVHLFGHGIESLALQCDTAKLQRVLAEAGHTALINVKLASEKGPRSVLVREVQTGMRKGELLHVDFYQVKMGEKISVEVPIVLAGQAPALKIKGNTLEQELDTITIECFPGKIPAHVEIDVSSLTEPDQVIRVKEIELDKEITLLDDPDLVVARIRPQPVEKVEEEAIAEKAAEIPEEAPLIEGDKKES
jgi:large subunit ribosomal protein L25